MTLLLTLTSVLWMSTDCQLNSDLADNPSSGLQSVSAQFSTPHLQTSFTAGSTLPSKTATGLSPTLGWSAPDLGTAGLSLEKHSEKLESSIFVSPTVTSYPISTNSEKIASSLVSDLQVSNSFSTVAETVEELGPTSATSENPSVPLVIKSTIFLDSVAASLRWNPVEEGSQLTWLVSHVQSSIPSDLGTGAPSADTHAPDEHSSNVLALVAPTPTWLASDSLTPSVTEDHAAWSSENHLETFTSSTSLPVFSSLSEMFNSTQPSANLHSVAAETTSPIWSSAPGVSSPGPAGGNTSCAEKDTGCVEYRREDEDKEEEVRIKIIVGVTCGAVLLVVILGELKKGSYGGGEDDCGHRRSTQSL